MSESRTLIINYHYCLSEAENPYLARTAVSSADFAIQVAQMTRMREEHGVTPLVTFDDGTDDVWRNAVPVLVRHDIPFILFICSAPLLEGRLLNVTKIHLLQAKLGIDVFRSLFLEALRTLGQPYELDDPRRINLGRIYRYDSDDVRQFKMLLNVNLPYPIVTRLLDELFETAFGSQAEVAKNIYMSATDVIRAHDAGARIGLHSHNHYMLSRLSVDEQENEIATCSQYFSNLLGYTVDEFSYPYGIQGTWNADTKSILSRHGISQAYTLGRQIHDQDTHADVYEIPRYDVNDVFDRAGKLPVCLVRMKHYDLVLVVGYFRTAMSFLSLVSALGRQLRIAVLSVEADPGMRSKTGEAHVTYLELCRKFGADLLNIQEVAHARLLIVQQFPYADELARRIRQKVTAENCVGLMTLAMAGVEKHDNYLRQFDIRKAYVPNRRFLDFLLARRNAQVRYSGVVIEEVGLPFARYPVFPEFRADWIIAAPTLFSFHNESGKQQFLRDVEKLLHAMPDSDVVVYKSHNGNKLDYFAPRIHYFFARMAKKIRFGESLLRFIQVLPLRWLRDHADRLQTCLLHLSILDRAMPMSHLTRYAEMSLEAFLPRVAKGVIGGLSNTIWGTLYFDLPFYNCVDNSMRQGESELFGRSSRALLDLNLEFFSVPYCQGDLSVDTRVLSIVGSDERRGDLIASVLADLGALG